MKLNELPAYTCFVPALDNSLFIQICIRYIYFTDDNLSDEQTCSDACIHSNKFYCNFNVSIKFIMHAKYSRQFSMSVTTIHCGYVLNHKKTKLNKIVFNYGTLV
jgi:hypothetical protein